MQVSKKVKLNSINYYIIIDLEYKKDAINDNLPVLCLKNYKDDYWDGGDCSILIEEIEKVYTTESKKKYDNNISYMADVLYIYDRIPFISGIKDIGYSQEGYISKDEIDAYIKLFNIKMDNNTDFKLSDERTWKI